MASVDAICISTRKGTTKQEVQEANFLTDYGIEGDAHGGKWHRQVSILSRESIDKFKRQLKTKDEIQKIYNGAFAENLIIEGLIPSEIKIGQRLRIGEEVILEITQIGKECHNDCIIKKLTGKCVMPTEGLFARVIRGGRVKPGMKVELYNMAALSNH